MNEIKGSTCSLADGKRLSVVMWSLSGDCNGVHWMHSL